MPNNDKTEDRDFAQFLAEFAHGSVNRTATDKLREIVAACLETSRKGSITIKIDIGINGKLAELRAHISSKKPENALPGAVFYTTEAGDLRDEDPRQLKMPAKIIDAPSTTLRTIPINATATTPSKE